MIYVETNVIIHLCRLAIVVLRLVNGQSTQFLDNFILEIICSCPLLCI